MQVTVGADPEFFVQRLKIEEQSANGMSAEAAAELSIVRIKAKTRKVKFEVDTEGEIVPICGLLGGTKDVPLALQDLGEGFAVQEDGVAAEFNIPPSKTPSDFARNMSKALDHIEGRMLRPKGLGRSYVNNLTLKPEWIEKFPAIKVVGCDPDYNAYATNSEGMVEPRVADPEAVGMVRGSGGHIHVGYPVEMCPPNIMAQLLDLMIALSYCEEDKQGARRAWWGQAGLYRPKPYGVEYRTLSNFWIWSNMLAADVAGRVFALTESLAKQPVAWQAMYNAVDWEKVRKIISGERRAPANALVAELRSRFQVYDAALSRGAYLAVGGD